MQFTSDGPVRKRKKLNAELNSYSHWDVPKETALQHGRLSSHYLHYIRPGSQLYAQSLYSCLDPHFPLTQESEAIAILKVWAIKAAYELSN